MYENQTQCAVRALPAQICVPPPQTGALISLRAPTPCQVTPKVKAKSNVERACLAWALPCHCCLPLAGANVSAGRGHKGNV
jgi:hypothetical protein